MNVIKKSALQRKEHVDQEMKSKQGNRDRLRYGEAGLSLGDARETRKHDTGQTIVEWTRIERVASGTEDANLCGDVRAIGEEIGSVCVGPVPAGVEDVGDFA